MQLSPHAQPDVQVRQQPDGPPSLPHPTNTSANTNTSSLAIADMVAGSAIARNSSRSVADTSACSPRTACAELQSPS